MEIKKKKISKKDVLNYIVGWYRYYIFYSVERWNINLTKLMRTHIREQIESRIKRVNRECYNRGSCIHCGCQVPALQMVNDPCQGECYGEFLNKNKWEKLKSKIHKHDELESN